MELRPYQQTAVERIHGEWDAGRQKTLLVLPTGTGKTITFAKVAEDQVRARERVLILAHRGELLDQAADKMKKATGLNCSVEKAEQSCLGSWERVTVGSIQSLAQETRLAKFSRDHFQTIIVDEAHHALSDTYQRVLTHFGDAKVLGVTATPDRGDMRNLGQFFESLAFEYKLPQAIRDGYLCPIKARTIPLKIDLSKVKVQNGDFSAGDLGSALDPYLEQIATEMEQFCQDRKTVVFLPLVATSQKFRDILNAHGFKAAEVNGNSSDRSEVLEDFAAGKYNVLCNSMLLTEGWDCPDVDCIIVLRPTKVRSLYCLDEDTEILTRDGWKKDVEVGEDVAAFIPETGEIRFTPALAKVRRPLRDDEFFCSLKGQSSDIRVTNKHRMLYDNKRRTGWKIKTAEEVADLKDGCMIPVAGTNSFPGVPLTDDEIKFIGWVMTDGSINKLNNAITITQESHQPWLEEIQKCIEGCGFKYNRFERFEDTGYKRTSPVVYWTISKGKPRGRDKHLRGWGALENYLSKDLSPELDEMTERQFDILLHTIHLADGHKQQGQGWTQRSYHISKGNKKFIENLQIMAIKRGWRASVAVDEKTNLNPLYTIHLKKQTFIKVGAHDGAHASWKKEEHTNENCWCVQTEPGTLVTRRNGKVTMMGNCQMVGRGTRISPNKDHLLLLDFLWHTERHELCHPAYLIAETEEVAKRMTKDIDESGEAVDIEEAEETAQQEVIQDREAALAEKLAAMRKKQARLVDPLQFQMSILDEDLINYIPTFVHEMAPASSKQLAYIEKMGLLPDTIQNAGHASMIINKLMARADAGLATPKQIRQLEQRGFLHVGQWTKEQATKMIGRIAKNHWMTPFDIDPATYTPR